MRTYSFRHRGLNLAFWTLPIIFILTAFATPPTYTTFRRTQRSDYSPEPSQLLRIWMVHVAQGDGLLIQLPSKYDYDPDLDDGDNARTERVDIIIDGGANPTSESGRMGDFITQIYGGISPTIEYTVITHHDQDHVVGITKMLNGNDFIFDTIFHNGLASYRGGKHGLPLTNKPANVVGEMKVGKLSRAMGSVNESKEFDPGFLIQNLEDLKDSLNKEELQGIYEDLARAVANKADRNELRAFQRAHYSAPFIAERQAERGQSLSEVQFSVLWPPVKAKSYGGNNWGETINGNSVTFQLVYKDFAMVFTGDHNDKSQPELLSFLRTEQKLNWLECDVLKVPHHGSSHGVKDFFAREDFEPVLAIASMGDVGFRSKQMSSGAWEHPSTDVIEWLGGPHRVYHTCVEEKAFTWSDITTEAKRISLIEKSHILIETDGTWFRLVEIPIEKTPLPPPTVTQTRRGNGTRWIKASKD